MVLLRSLFCWDWEDVLFFVTNARASRRELSADLEENIKKWNKFDSAIFDHFNQTFWTKVKNLETFDADKKTLEELIGTGFHYFRFFGNDAVF